MLAASPGTLVLENRFMAVEIDGNSAAVRSVSDRNLNVTYPLDGIGFEVTTSTGIIRPEKASIVKSGDGEAVLRTINGGLEVTVHYTLSAGDPFIEKWLEIKAADGKPYFLKSAALEEVKTTAFTDIHFHDDQTIWHCPINLFLRSEKGGCFAGIEYPYWDLKQKGKDGFRLGYSPNCQVGAGETHTSEKYFLGVYRKEGICRYSQGPYPGRGRSSLVHWGDTGLGQQFKNGTIPSEVTDVPGEVLDWGEAWTMQEFMRHVHPDDLQLPEDGYWVWQNGWWAGLFDPKTEILERLRSAGIHDIMTAHTWYGRGKHPNLEDYLYKMRIDPLGFPRDEAAASLPGATGPAAGWHSPQAATLDAFKPGEFTSDFRAPPAMERFLDYGEKIGVHVSSFAAPGMLFEAKPEWYSIDVKGNPSLYLFGRGVSCPASDAYIKHLLALHESVFAKYQPRWWGWDGRWLSFWEVANYRPGSLGCGPDPCYAKNHGHLPGDNSYKEWKNIQWFLKEIRQRHPRLCLETYYGLKRGEPWALRYLNAADNYFETNGADMNRLQAWHNQNDRFRPVYKNYSSLFGSTPKQFQYNVISAISMSAYCQVGPAFQALAIGENREFLIRWRAWATKNCVYLKFKRDLFDCPGDSVVDGSAHMIKDRGFIFLFPGGYDNGAVSAKPVRASIVMNRWLGLEERSKRFFSITEIYPRNGSPLGVYRYGEEFSYDIPAGSAVVLSVLPAPAGSTPCRQLETGAPDTATVVRAFDAPPPRQVPATWPLVTVADLRRDAAGNLLPLQSYDETIRRGMSFLLDDHLKWFKGSAETLLDEMGRTQMPWVYYSNLQQSGAPFPNSPDRFVSYPAFHHALLIRTFIGFWRYAGDKRALKQAVDLADWDIAHSTPADWPYANLPWSTFQEKKPGGFRDKSGLMPDKAAMMGLAYLQLHEATGESRFLKAAEAIAKTLAARQRPDGTWPFRTDPKTEAVIENYTSSVIYAVRLFESLDKLNGNDRYRAHRDRTWNWLVNGPIKTKEFRGFYEDIPASPDGRTNYDCLDTIRYLLAHWKDNNSYLKMAKDLNAWVEATFLDRIKGFEPAEGIREQLQCNVVMGIHSLNWAAMLMELARATGDETLRRRAMQTANYITYYLQPDNRIVVGFQYDQWWYSCHAGVIRYLFDFLPADQTGTGGKVESSAIGHTKSN